MRFYSLVLLAAVSGRADGQQVGASAVRLLFPWWLVLAAAGALVLSVALLHIKPPPSMRLSRFPWMSGNTVLLALVALLAGGWIAERRLVSRLDSPTVPTVANPDIGAIGAGRPAGLPASGATFTFVTIVAAAIGTIAVGCLVLFALEAQRREVRVETHWGGLGGGAGGWKLSPALLYLVLALVLFSMLTVIATRALASADEAIDREAAPSSR